MSATENADTNQLRFRQVHLDFHTSEEIARIGADFDADEFADVLVAAHVDSITCFGRCHHGWLYYDTQAHPERRHPHIQRNLLREQIEACHARNIRVPIYLTVQWDQYTSSRHPEWLCLTPEGQIQGTPPFEAGFYRKLCLNSPYKDWLKGHVLEVLETLPTDGLFFDIVQPNDCACHHCRTGMLEKGLDPSDAVQRQTYGLEVVNGFKREMTAFVREKNADCTIFYNAGHIGPRHRQIADAYTHWELESLPSGGWGYLHFPLTVRYARNLGIDCLGMTGKFHTSWGDFHSYKTPEALQFECFTMLALNAKCSVGDQLHPEGRIDGPTYDLIGSVYKEVEKKEPWCVGAEPLVDIGVFSPEEFAAAGTRLPLPAMGAVRLLQEGAQQFNIIDSASELGKYKVVILPDDIELDNALVAKLEHFVDAGGALIASYKSGIFAGKEGPWVLKGDAPYSPDFIVPEGALAEGLPSVGHVMYMRGLEVEPKGDTQVLAHVEVPYFERDWRHFCSHKHTPSAFKKAYPAVLRAGDAIYFTHPIFSQYAQNAPRWCKQLVLNALEMLLPEPLVRIDGPSTITSALNAQPGRQVLHLLHYVPERRGADFDVIEDVIPLYNISISVRADAAIKEVVLAPEGEALDFSERDGRIEFVLPALHGHQMVALYLA